MRRRLICGVVVALALLGCAQVEEGSLNPYLKTGETVPMPMSEGIAGNWCGEWPGKKWNVKFVVGLWQLDGNLHYIDFAYSGVPWRRGVQTWSTSRPLLDGQIRTSDKEGTVTLSRVAGGLKAEYRWGSEYGGNSFETIAKPCPRVRGVTQTSG